MNCIRRALCVVVLSFPTFAFASDTALRDIGTLLLTGRGAEARAQIETMRDTLAREGRKADEAAMWLLLGMVETTGKHTHTAIAHLRTAAEKFREGGDHFGAWMSLWAIATLERDGASPDEAMQTYEAIFQALRAAESSQEPFSMVSVQTLGTAFGADTQVLGPFAANPELLKPMMLDFSFIVSHESFAQLLIDIGNLERAEEELRNATRRSPLLVGFFQGSLDIRYGRLRQQQWRLDEAYDHYLKSLKHAQKVSPMFMPPAVAGDPWAEVRVLRDLAEVEVLRGRLDEALKWSDRARKLVQERKDVEGEARILRQRANLLQQGGRYADAIAGYDDALKLAGNASSPGLEGEIHADLGTLHMTVGAYGKAVSHMEKAIALQQAAKNVFAEAGAWMLLAETYLLVEDDANADMALAKGRKMAEQSGFHAARAMVDVIASARKVVKGRGDRAEFDAAIQKLLATPQTKIVLSGPGLPGMLRDGFNLMLGAPVDASRSLEPGMPPVMSAMHRFFRGKAAFQARDVEAARRHFNEALLENPNREHKAGIVGMIGATYWVEGKRAEAVRHFQTAADELDAVANDVKVEELLTNFLGSARHVYFDVLIDMLVEDKRPMEAFTQAERARARAFLHVIGNHRLNAATGADPRLVTEAENVRAGIVAREQELLTAAPEDVARLTADLQRAREHYRSIVIRMKATNREYTDLANVAPRDVSMIGMDLPANTTLINYYVSSRAVHAWVIDSESAHHELLPLGPATLHPLTCWAERLGATGMRGVEVPGAPCSGDPASPEDAYRLLFAPLRKHVRHERILLVPHGVLHYIPFAALRNPETNRYLVQDYTLLFTPSASAIRFLREKETPVAGTALVLGDPETPLPGLEPLPAAKQEAAFTARIFGTTPHLGPDARESLLYDLNGRYDLVHLAAHAIYDARDPIFSRVALAPDGQHDGSLTVHEILSSVDLKGVNLVVVSACRSAIGQRSAGDEVVGLTRALLYAGTPGVISTLWNISDRATAALMKDFYDHLGRGLTAADALRAAQLAAIGSESRSDPKSWAAFMLTGDPQGRWTAARGARTAQ